MAAAAVTSCSDFEPTGYEPAPYLPQATDIASTLGAKHIVDVTWNLPQATDGLAISDVQFILNGDNANPVSLGPTATSYSVAGVPMGKETVFTVKVCYDDRYVSQGTSLLYTMPVETFPGVTGVAKEVKGRKVFISWTNPAGSDGVRILRNGEVIQTLDPGVTSTRLVSQPMEEELNYQVEALWDTYYTGEPYAFDVTIPFIQPNTAFLLLADKWEDLPDDDERAAAEWFSKRPNSKFVKVADIPSLDTDSYPVMWIMVDRVGQASGWQNLPGGLGDQATIDALKNYSAEGGALYLSNMASFLSVPLGMVLPNMTPTVFGSGNGGSGTDVWLINPHLGVDFMNGGAQGYYDRAEHAIFKGIQLEDPNNWGFTGVPLIGPGAREDHNCLWDLNIYGKGDQKDVIANFEVTCGCMVLATWGHVRDHCVAGLVVFEPTPEHAKCVVNGFAAYEWNQNSNDNIYQANLEMLTENILNYLN